MNRAFCLGLVHAALALSPLPAQAADKSASPRAHGVVNLNSATPEQLRMLPGVKEKQAKEIVAHRARHPFARAEELIGVKGFSKKRFQRVKPFVTVQGDTTFQVADKAVRAVEKKRTQR